MKNNIMKIESCVDEMLMDRDRILREVQELQADLEDLSDDDLIDCRVVMLERVNKCLILLDESDEDNIG